MNPAQRKHLSPRHSDIFDAVVDRRLNPPNAEEQTKSVHDFFLDGQHPIIVPRQMLLGHVRLIGDPGAGKTSAGLTAQIKQLIEQEKRKS